MAFYREESREEQVLQRILALYDSIKEVPFYGQYEGIAPIQYEGGKITPRYLVKVYSPTNILDVMSKIWDVDRGDMVWKGIVNDTFYAEEIYGQMTNMFKIVTATPVNVRHWKRKEYYAVINVTLAAVY